MDTMFLTAILIGMLLMSVAIKGGANMPEAIPLMAIMVACVIALERR